MKQFLQQLFDYNFHCNSNFIAFCEAQGGIPEQAETWFSHILNAHHLWNSRIEGSASKFDPWEKHPREQWEEIHQDNQRFTFTVLTREDNFMRSVMYESTEGKNYTNSLQDILFHIINHSTHHRAQIAANLRTHGIDPPAFDYIYYKR